MSVVGRKTPGSRLFDVFVYGGSAFAAIICLYPFLYILSSSVSSTGAVVRGDVWLWPVGFSVNAYKVVFSDSVIWTSYYNTIWYTFIGTAFNVVFTVIAGYPLSRKRFFARDFFMVIFVFKKIVQFLNNAITVLSISNSSRISKGKEES